MIVGQEGHEYSDIIYKYLPTKSKVIKNREYITLKKASYYEKCR